MNLRPAGRLVLAAVLVTAIATGAGATGLLTAHVVRYDERGTQLLWSDQEAYLLIGSLRKGWSGSYMAAGWWFVMGYFWLSAPVEQLCFRTEVIHLTGDRLERATAHAFVAGRYWPVHGQIHTISKGTVHRWTGAAFEPVTGGAARVAASARPPCCDWSGLGGWSAQENILNLPHPVSITMNLEGHRVTVHATNRRRGNWSERTLELQRGDHAPERLWSADSKPRFVSAAEYDALCR